MNKSSSGELKVLTKVIRQRRSVYADEFLGGEIEDETIWEILGNAIWAPTHKMTEPWRFIVFKGRHLRDFGEYMAAFYHDHYKSVLSERDFLAKSEYLRAYPLKAACMIGIVLVRNTKIGLPEWEEIAAVSCAVQNMALTCEAMGHGGYWSTSAAAIEYVFQTGLKENERSLGIFYMGKKSEVVLESKKRRSSLESKVVIM